MFVFHQDLYVRDCVVIKCCVIRVNIHCSNCMLFLRRPPHALCERRGGRQRTGSRVTGRGCRQAGKGQRRCAQGSGDACLLAAWVLPPSFWGRGAEGFPRAQEAGREAGGEGSIFQQEHFSPVESVKLFQSNPRITPQTSARFVEAF